MSVEKMKILDYLWLHMVKNVIKGFFPMSKVLVFEGNSYVCEKKWRYQTILWLHMVKNVIKGSFPMSKVLVFEGNSFVRGKNEDFRLFYDCKW